MVAADRAREDSSDRDDKNVGRRLSENGDGDWDEDAECAPARARREGKPCCNEEEERRQEHDNARIGGDNRADEAAEVEVLLAADPRERPCKAEDEDGRGHCLESPAEAVAEHVERDDAARQVEQPRKDEGDERPKHERF